MQLGHSVGQLGFPKMGCNEACHQSIIASPRRFLFRHFFEKISPPLHHLPPFRQILSVVIGGTNLVALDVRELSLNGIGAEKAAFVEDR